MRPIGWSILLAAAWASVPGLSRAAEGPGGEKAAPAPPAAKPTIPRQDKLILKTMNREDILEFILDGLEDALPELEALWVQEPGKRGTWKYGGKGRSPAFGGYDVHYGMLLLERPK